MIEVLSLSNHRLTNAVFVAMNVLAVLAVVLGIVSTTMWFTATDVGSGELAFSRLMTGIALLFGHVVLAVVLAGLAQLLRYLASLTEILARQALAAGARGVPPAAHHPTTAAVYPTTHF